MKNNPGKKLLISIIKKYHRHESHFSSFYILVYFNLFRLSWASLFYLFASRGVEDKIIYNQVDRNVVPI